MKTALILIDIQNDYFPGGKGELENPLEAARQARKLLDFFRLQKWPTVHIQHVATRPGATTFLPDTDGVRIHESITPLAGETVIVKHFPNSFRETGLLEHLQGLNIERLVICGMMTAHVRGCHHACRSRLRIPRAAGGGCLRHARPGLRRDGSPRSIVHAAFLAALKSYGQVLKTAEILEQLKG